MQLGGVQPCRFGNQVRTAAQQVDGLAGGDALFGQWHRRVGGETRGGAARRLGEQGVQRQLRFGQVDIQLIQIGFPRRALGGCGFHIQSGHFAGMEEQSGDALQLARHFNAFDQQGSLALQRAHLQIALRGVRGNGEPRRYRLRLRRTQLPGRAVTPRAGGAKQVQLPGGLQGQLPGVDADHIIVRDKAGQRASRFGVPFSTHWRLAEPGRSKLGSRPARDWRS